MQSASHDIKANVPDISVASSRAAARAPGSARSGINTGPRVTEQAKRQHDIFGPAVQPKSPAAGAINRTGLEDEVKANMEAGFHADLSDIRIHANSPEAPKVNALAFTRGWHIHFAPGQFDPGTREGRQIIGHELAHVVQQQTGRVHPTGTIAGMPVNDNPALEREADAAGARVSNMTPWKKGRRVDSADVP